MIERAIKKANPRRKPHDDEEHRNQVWLMQWVALNIKKYPDLRLLYAIPNGGKRDHRTAAKLKAEGVKAGVHDLHLPAARGGYIGLWIELKVGKNRPTESQREWGELMRSAGHRVRFCWGWEDASEVLAEYLALPETISCSSLMSPTNEE